MKQEPIWWQRHQLDHYCQHFSTLWSRLDHSGVVTALKPVRAEQVRWPEWKQNSTVPHCGSVLPICLSLRPVRSIHISCLAAREQTSAAQIAKASPPYNMKYFYSFFGIIFQFYFKFFWLKRPSTSARTVVPLTTPLVQFSSGAVNKRSDLQNDVNGIPWSQQPQQPARRAAAARRRLWHGAVEISHAIIIRHDRSITGPSN